jgi:hypothetical protein
MHFSFSLFFLLVTLLLNAQIAPGVEWRKSTWSPRGLDLNLQTQVQSGEEWWYSHKNVYNAQGTHTSYVTVGYTSLVSTTATYTDAQLFFNEGPDSPFNPIDPVTYDYTTLAEGCSDRDYLGEHRTPPRGNLGLNALDGSMIYCKPKTIGALEEVVQDPAEPTAFYVVGVHVGVRPYKNKTDFIPYNPTSSAPANYFSLSAMGVSNYTNVINHIYIAKCHLDGSVIWEGLYGYLDYSTSAFEAYKAEGYGYDIIKSSNGNLVATGFARLNSIPNGPSYPILLEIDPTTGHLLNKAVLPTSGPGLTPATNSVTGYVKYSFGQSVEEIGTTGKYAVVVTYFFGNSTYFDNNNAYLWGVDENLNVNTSWTNNPIRLMGVGPDYNSIAWEVIYHKASGQLMVPVVRDCAHCATAGSNAGYGFVYRFNPDGSMVTNGVNPSPMGRVNAFDLRAGVAETSDGGFVAVSSTRPPGADHSNPTPLELGYLAGCTTLDYTDWDTDALIVKFDANGKAQWSKTFDVGDNRKREAPPLDMKRQECMYKITQSQDGGYVISGNSSGNFDDFYMAKLYNDCNATQSYTWGPSYVMDIKSPTTWNSSMNVIGKVIIHPGAVLTVKGASTTIRFADSELTGIKTEVLVMNGGLLQFQDGASFSSIDTSGCKNSKWDGIKYDNDINVDNTVVLFPNPASQNFNILYNGTQDEEITFTVSDMLGKVLRDGKLTSDLLVQINTEAYGAGVYTVCLYKGKKVMGTKKLVVVRS